LQKGNNASGDDKEINQAVTTPSEQMLEIFKDTVDEYQFKGLIKYDPTQINRNLSSGIETFCKMIQYRIIDLFDCYKKLMTPEELRMYLNITLFKFELEKYKDHLETNPLPRRGTNPFTNLEFVQLQSEGGLQFYVDFEKFEKFAQNTKVYRNKLKSLYKAIAGEDIA
jgi:hypothetical protein